VKHGAAPNTRIIKTSRTKIPETHSDRWRRRQTASDYVRQRCFCKMRCELRDGGTRMAEEPCLLHSRCKGRVEAAPTVASVPCLCPDPKIQAIGRVFSNCGLSFCPAVWHDSSCTQQLGRVRWPLFLLLRYLAHHSHARIPATNAASWQKNSLAPIDGFL
jgi:hypothetical protein